MCGAERRVRHDLYERANTTSAASSLGRAVGHEAQTGTMILALAMRHSVERPAIRMGGGTNDPMERLARRRLDFAFEKIHRETVDPHYLKVRILSFFKSRRETQIQSKRGVDIGCCDSGETAKDRDRDQNWQYDLHSEWTLRRRGRHRFRKNKAFT